MEINMLQMEMVRFKGMFVANGCKSNGTRNGEVVNGINMLKGKMKNKSLVIWILSSEDHGLLAKREELKETLEKEALTFLLSCSFSNDVENCMRVTKLCEANDGLHKNELNLHRKHLYVF